MLKIIKIVKIKKNIFKNNTYSIKNTFSFYSNFQLVKYELTKLVSTLGLLSLSVSGLIYKTVHGT